MLREGKKKGHRRRAAAHPKTPKDPTNMLEILTKMIQNKLKKALLTGYKGFI